MPIDPNIPLSVKPPQIDSPLEMASNFLAIKRAREASVERMRDEQEDREIQRVLQESQGDIEAAFPKIRQISVPKSLKLEETYGKSVKAKSDLALAQLSVQDKMGELLSKELNTVTDQNSYDHYRAYAASVRQAVGLPDSPLDPVYSPEVVDKYKMSGMTFAQQQAEKRAELVAQTNAAREDRMAADQRADNERQAAAAEQSKRQFETTEARQNREFAVTSGLAARAEARQAKAAAAGGGSEEGGLVDAVIANPSLWDELTPTVKGKIAPALRAKGFDSFGKPLSNAAVKEIAQSKSAIDGLNDLKASLKENDQYVGPLAGLQALNPYSDARKVQAKIDLQRQRVGKTLEGGVLRKEDEEKYKKILSVLTDEPTTAIAKIDNVIAAVEQDIKNYTNEQRLAGRRVNPETTANVGPGYAKTRHVNDVVTVRGKKVKITKVLPNGQFEGVPVP